MSFYADVTWSAYEAFCRLVSRRRGGPGDATTNAIESINVRYRRAVEAQGNFPNEASRAEAPVPDY